MTENELNRRLCDICQMDEEHCDDCDHRTGRRKNDYCISHQDMEKEKKYNERFRTQIKTGILVGGFFLLTFMTGISSSNYVASKDMDEKHKEFVVEAKKVQETHKNEVKTALMEMRSQVDYMVSAVNRMETNVNTLVNTTEFERKRAKEERESNHLRIEALQRELAKCTNLNNYNSKNPN